MFHLDIDQLAALSADRMVVTLRHPVKAARTVAKLYLRDMSSVLQKSQAIVNSRERYARELGLRRGEDLVRREMLMRVANDP